MMKNLYDGVKISVKILDAVIVSGIAALAFIIAFQF